MRTSCCIAAFLLILSGCTPPAKPPRYLLQTFRPVDVQYITVLPAFDHRENKELTVDLDKIAQALKKNLENKKYEVRLTSSLGETGSVNRADISEAKPEWIQRLGPNDTRWVLVMLIEKTSRSKTFTRQTGQADVLGALFDKASGKLVWIGAGHGDVELGGGLTGALASAMTSDNDIVYAAIFDLMQSLPPGPR